MFIPYFINSEEPKEKLLLGMDLLIYSNYENSDFVYFVTPDTFINMAIADIFNGVMEPHIEYLKDLVRSLSLDILFSSNNFPIRKSERGCFDPTSRKVAIDNSSANKVFSRLQLYDFIKRTSLFGVKNLQQRVDGNVMFKEDESCFIFVPYQYKEEDYSTSRIAKGVAKDALSGALSAYNPIFNFVIPGVAAAKNAWDVVNSKEVDRDMIKLIASSSDMHSVGVTIHEYINSSPDTMKYLAKGVDLKSEVARIKAVVESKVKEFSRERGDIVYEVMNKANSYIDSGVCDDEGMAYIRAYYFLSKGWAL